MNRRDFATMAMVGLGLTATRAGQASGLAMWRAPASPPAQVPTPPVPTPVVPVDGMIGQSPLLARAREALQRHAAVIPLRDRVALADFSRPSREPRFHIVDLISGQVQSYLVAHGRGSDPEHSGWLARFSNVPDSLASSAGAYRTGEIYHGKYGRSMRLAGLDPTNDNAEARAIVVHGAWYVSENQVATWGKVGRSEGCFAVAEHLMAQVLGMLGPNRLLFADKIA